MWRLITLLAGVLVLVCCWPFLRFGYSYYVKGPLSSWRRHRYFREPTIEISERRSAWPEVEVFFQMAEEQVCSLGFLPRRTFRISGMPDQLVFALVFENTNTGDRGCAYATHNIVGATGGAHLGFAFEFSSDMGSDYCICTTNSIYPFPSWRTPWKEIVQFPGLVDLSAFHAAHQEVVARSGRSRCSSRAWQFTPGELIDIWNREMGHHVSQGMLKVDEKEGIYRATWRLLPDIYRFRQPFRRLWEKRALRTAGAILERCSHPYLYQQQDYRALVRARMMESLSDDIATTHNELS